MTAEEFRVLLMERSDQDLVGMCLRSDVIPYVFDLDEPRWRRFRDNIAQNLGVLSTGIGVVGSARFGFSLKPGNNFRKFEDTSDIDLVVVSEEVFDDLWSRLLRGVYPRPPAQIGGWLRDRQKEVYTGWLTPTAIRPDLRIYGQRVKPILEISHLWFSALKRASSNIEKSHEKINARLYRSWLHAELYHLHSIKSLKAKTSEES